ncbi:MAG: hypothetical protein R3E84_09730 [Pseudomonadales bacterium]
MDNTVRVFIGYDSNEIIAYHVLAHSILEHASLPVSITPVMQSQLRGVYHRESHALASTEFSFSRFLVPWLCNYEGWAIFIDCDMLCLGDIAELWSWRRPSMDLMVVKHDHRPTSTTKFNNNVQTRYEKKNWSSVMLMNCARARTLTPEYVNTATGLELHQFKWLEDENRIGALPHRWNHLAGYDAYDPDAAIVHYTEGGPYFNAYRNCEYSAEWRATLSRMLSVNESIGEFVPEPNARTA